MKFTTFLKDPCDWLNWHKWFAWHPVTLCSDPSSGKQTWVWLEYVWRRWVYEDYEYYPITTKEDNLPSSDDPYFSDSDIIIDRGGHRR